MIVTCNNRQQLSLYLMCMTSYFHVYRGSSVKLPHKCMINCSRYYEDRDTREFFPISPGTYQNVYV